MEFVINNIIGRSHCNMTALRFILLTETLVCSVHETADLTCDLFRRIGIRLDGFSSQLVTSDDAADLRKLNSVLLGHLEDKKRNCDLQFLLVLLIRFYCMGSSILSASCFARSSILY